MRALPRKVCGGEVDGRRRLEHEVKDMLRETRYVPTLELYDALWRPYFHSLRARGQGDVVDYLCSQYFDEVAAEKVRKGLRVGALAWGSTNVLFSGHWCGVLGTHPGTGTGSQTVEALHNVWSQTLRAKTKDSPGGVLESMQRLFRDVWCARYSWGQTRRWSMHPPAFNPHLFNSHTLRVFGRSPARDYWEHRATPNYAKCSRTETLAPAGGVEGSTPRAPTPTTFWVMRGRRCGDAMPARELVTGSAAEGVVNLIRNDGHALRASLQEAGIVTGSPHDLAWAVSVLQLRQALTGYAVVMVGGFVDAYWSRSRTWDRTERLTTLVCTCPEYSHHAQCEHIIFVLALQGDPRCDLRNVPLARKTGRPPKSDGSASRPARRARKQ